MQVSDKMHTQSQKHEVARINLPVKNISLQLCKSFFKRKFKDTSKNSLTSVFAGFMICKTASLTAFLINFIDKQTTFCQQHLKHLHVLAFPFSFCSTFLFQHIPFRPLMQPPEKPQGCSCTQKEPSAKAAIHVRTGLPFKCTVSLTYTRNST